MTFTIDQIAQSLGLEAVGDGSVSVDMVTEPALAGPQALALAMTEEFAATLTEGSAQAALMWHGADWQSYGLRAALLPRRPRYALSALSALMDRGPDYGNGHHPSALIDPTAELEQGVSIGAFSVIGAGVRIGAGSVIGPQCYIGHRSVLGANSVLHAGVRIGTDVSIGTGFIAGFGATVGGDGFSFVTPEPSGAEKARQSLGGENAQDGQSWARIHSLGGVTIGDHVELGANSTVDRGTVRDTMIGSGTKIDNLVQVGHNVVIGTDCMLCAQAGIAGSSQIGNHVILGGKVGISDNIKVGDRAVLGGASIALTNVPAGRIMLGYPAQKMDSHIETYKALRRLPRMLRDLSDLKKTVSNLGRKD